MAGHIEPHEGVYSDKLGYFCRVVIPVTVGRGARKRTRIVRGRTEFQTRQAAERELRELQRLVEGGIEPPASVTVERVLRRWLSERVAGRLAPSTERRYRGIVEKDLIPAFGRFPVMRLRPANLSDYYLKRRKAGLSPSTVHHHYRCIHAALRWALEMELVQRNVADVAKPPRGRAPEFQTLTPTQMLGLLDSVKGTELELPVMIATCTGMRQGEVLGLRWGDIDLERGTVTVRHSLEQLPRQQPRLKDTKTNQMRTVWLPPIVVQALEPLSHDKLPRAYVCHRKGKPLSANVVRHRWAEVRESLGLEDLRFHDLRHSFATMMLEQGANVKAVQTALGHSTAVTTLNVYAHITEQMQEHSRELINRVFDVEPEPLTPKPPGADSEDGSRTGGQSQKRHLRSV